MTFLFSQASGVSNDYFVTLLLIKAIGAIKITDRFSMMEVPEESIIDVIAALRASTIKGKKLTVRRDLAGGR